MARRQKIRTFLWFDTQAEEAARFYTSIFKKSKITGITRYGEAGPGPEGTVMTVTFRLEGQEYVALNGGPQFKFTEAVSLQVHCKNQKEVDRLWRKLTAGGEESQCGWLKDKFGLSWQITPIALMKLLHDKDPGRVHRVMEAMFTMKKLDIARLKAAGKG
jgi:predicted 3-demethylubiquinone-9 3-methyltransferase (glyoxalase superfamily)